MDGEETGNEGRAFAHALDGVSYELPRLGKLSFENTVANPATGQFTVVASTDDSTPGQIYVYAGTKTASGGPVDRAGLTNGTLYGIKVNGVTTENSATGIPSGTPFTVVSLGNVENATGAALEAASNAAGVTRFLRPEDGAWDPSSPNDFYFVTTNAFTAPSRLWRLRFVDASHPELGGHIDMLLDGTEGQKMMDNITINGRGQVIIQEDPGNQAYVARVHRYDVATDTLTTIAQHDPNRFLLGAPSFLTQDEESSGVVDVSDILGEGWYLLDVQAHYATDAELVEGGQLMALHVPPGRP
jgi:secreted PhoX family phosphatase